MLRAVKRPDTEQAIQEGARRSREACSLRAADPGYVILWRRRKWWIIGAGLLILEGIVMGTLGSTMARHF